MPVTVAFLQLLLGIPLFLPIWIVKPPSYDFEDFPTHAKIALTHSMGNLASIVSFASGSVSFTHVVKASEPLVTAFLSAAVLGQTLSTPVYLSLLPIVFGVAVASVKELSFTWVGFLSALASNVFYQLRIVLAKKEMSRSDHDHHHSLPLSTTTTTTTATTGALGGANNSSKKSLSPANLFRVITLISTGIMFPLVLLFDSYRLPAALRRGYDQGMTTSMLLFNIVVSGTTYYAYNEVAFWILEIVSPITHAVGNTIKRVVIILAAIVILKAPITALGLIGSLIAVFGTFLFAWAQQRYK